MAATRTPAEQLKAEKNGLDVLPDIHRWAKEGWESIPPSEYDRLKYFGIFFRKATPGYFMMRIRVPGGVLAPGQLQALADITRCFGRDILDVTTRQQIQLRWIRFEAVPEILDRLSAIGLNSMQTGFDNIRNVTGCPVAGLDADEVFDATPWVRHLTDLFVGNREHVNLPRKINVSICGCSDDCAHAELNDIGLSPATREGRVGFNVRLAGAVGPWGNQHAWLLGWITPSQVVDTCRHIIEIYRDHGPREARNKARLRFLVAEWGLDRFRGEVERRAGFAVADTGRDEVRSGPYRDHIGVHPQRQYGRYYVGLVVPAGRLLVDQAETLCRLAKRYGSGELRLTTGQNVVLPWVPGGMLTELLAEPLLRELTPFPTPFIRGTVACTGNTFCSFALIDTKERARELAEELDRRLHGEDLHGLRLHVSGCPNSCGLHQVADIGLLGKKVKVDGALVDGCDVFLAGRMALDGAFGVRELQNVPFTAMPDVIEGVARAYLIGRHPEEPFRDWCIRTGRVADAGTTAALAHL